MLQDNATIFQIGIHTIDKEVIKSFESTLDHAMSIPVNKTTVKQKKGKLENEN